ncbi:MAG: hypothetical protein M3O90_04610 [Actinomycetota bacterium]|nr:hypothetical protein [Actinomycetota bacterium]
MTPQASVDPRTHHARRISLWLVPQPSDRAVLAVQGAYYVTTGALPFISRRAFEAATGPKQDWWLVETVGALVTVAGGALLSGAYSRRITPELLGVSAGSAASLAAIDILYVAKGRIAPTYLLDGAAQLALLGALSCRLRTRSRSHQRRQRGNRAVAAAC